MLGICSPPFDAFMYAVQTLEGAVPIGAVRQELLFVAVDAQSCELRVVFLDPVVGVCTVCKGVPVKLQVCVA